MTWREALADLRTHHTPLVLWMLLGLGLTAASAPNLATLVFGSALTLILIASSEVDRRHHILPDSLTLLVALLGLGWLITQTPMPLWWVGVAGAGVGGGGLWLLGRLGTWWAGQPALGLGDVKLLAALGLWVGLSGLPLVLLLATLPYLPWALWQLYQRRRHPHLPTQALPFGPGLAFGGWATWLWGAELWNLISHSVA